MPSQAGSGLGRRDAERSRLLLGRAHSLSTWQALPPFTVGVSLGPARNANTGTDPGATRCHDHQCIGRAGMN